MARPRAARSDLTKRTIDAAKPETGDVFLWDGRVHGLGLKVTPRGTKTFFLDKPINGRLRRITIGRYGDLTLDAARKAATKLVGQIAEGRDPIRERKDAREAALLEERQGITMSELWKRYDAEVINVHNKPSTAKEKRRMWSNRIEPKLGKTRVADVTDDEAGKIVRSPLRFHKDGSIASGKAQAGNLYRLLHHMMKMALVWGIRPRELGNPLEGITEPRVPRRERLLSSDEIGRVMAKLDEAERDGSERKVIVSAIRVAILTGARISEVLKLRWDDVREDLSEAALADTKTGYSRRPLSKEVLSILDSMKPPKDSEQKPVYVFPAVRDPKRPLPYHTVHKAFARITKAAKVANCSPHTIRHWFATMTANSVSNPRVGMTLTGHKSHAAYMNYIHGDRDQAHELANQLADFTKSLGRPANDERGAA